eukprot:Gb_40968 [translate_table: standard]
MRSLPVCVCKTHPLAWFHRAQFLLVVNPLRVCLAPLWLCLTAAADDSSAFDVNPPRLPSDEIAQISLSTQNDQNDYTRLPPVAHFDVFINHRGKDVKDTLASHLAPLCLCLTAADPPRLPSDEVAQTSLSTQNDYTRLPPVANFDHYQRYPQEVDEWRAALQKVSNISGLSLSDLKGRLATKVVQEVLKRIKSEPLRVAKFPVGLEEPVARLREYIIRCRMEKTQVAFVGIGGIAGIGKSTLANALFNSIRCNFERASYIEDIEGQVEKNGLLEVQRKLLLNLLHYDYQVPDLSHSQAEQIIRKRLSNIDDLILLDNIEDYQQLDAILSPEVLLPGSTVIVTSRDSNVFKRCNNFLKYNIPGL